MAFDNALWIWSRESACADEFADFACCFDGLAGDWKLNISADSDYNVYINGELAAFGQYADYPFYKVYDSVDVSAYVKRGINRMVIKVWYYGIDSQTYVKGNAGLIFELLNGGNAVVCSNKDILSRVSHDYISGQCKIITGQLGLTYCYDSSKNDGCLVNCDDGFSKSVELANRSRELVMRPISKLTLDERAPFNIVRCGSYRYADNTLASEIRMRDADLFDHETKSMKVPLIRRDGYDGIFVIVDVGSEVAGFLDMEFCVPSVASIDIGYGEHLIDGRCRTSIGKRAFAATYVATAGENKFLGSFRRFGCRYVQIFVPAESLELKYLGIRPTVYPVAESNDRPKNKLRHRIYDVCVNTLRQCMHEHYEDCPWREQALYTMDSRNQMLCGYYAFNEYKFARASLLLISKGVRKDGILSLCYPAGLDFPIPAFSLMYFVQMWEYIEHSGDISLAGELYGMLTDLISVFVRRIDGNGLILTFPEHWNFYEWSETMSGSLGKHTVPRYEAPLNAFLVLALRAFSKISNVLGFEQDTVTYLGLADDLAAAITKYFWNESVGLFMTLRDCDKYSVLTNALCLLCGAAEHINKQNILNILSANGGTMEQVSVIPNTLSMNSFRFDALLAESKERYSNVILEEIDRDYGYMLENGATAFWETIKGAADFGGAGSLCHGWSALPIYYYNLLDM